MPKSVIVAAAALAVFCAASAARAADTAPAPAAAREAVAVPQDVLVRYVGRYQVTPVAVAAITVEDGQLYGALPGRPKIALSAQTPSQFFGKTANGDDAELSFEVGPDGRAVGFQLQLNGMTMSAPRIADGAQVAAP